MGYRKVDYIPPAIIGVTGFKQHGKDTFANFLNTSPSGKVFTIIHFADALKQITSKVFGINMECFVDVAKKEAPFDQPIVIDMFLGALKTETGLPLLERNLVAHSPRELLQYIGTDYVRSVDNEYWIKRTGKEIRKYNNVVVPDVRYQNEADLINRLGGKIIKITRIDFPPNSDGHLSETSITNISPFVELGVRTGDLSISERLAHLIATNRKKYLRVYHYPNVQNALSLYQIGGAIIDCTKILGIQHNDSNAFRYLLNYYGIPKRMSAQASNSHFFDNGVEKKQCSKCKEWKPLSCFSKSNRSYDTLHSICKSCASSWHKERYAKYQSEKNLQFLFKTCRNQARHRGLDFDLSLEEIEYQWDKQLGLCFYTKQPLTFMAGDPCKVSIDRIDSNSGYNSSNVVLCCSRINLMKKDMTVLEFFETVKLLYHNHNYSE